MKKENVDWPLKRPIIGNKLKKRHIGTFEQLLSDNGRRASNEIGFFRYQKSMRKMGFLNAS